MIFHKPQKKIVKPNISIDNVTIECVHEFNLLEIHLNEHMTWKNHINYISTNISKSLGVLNRLKFILPSSVKLILYNAVILSRINYGILLWGYECGRIFRLQKKAIRIIPLS